MIDSLNALPSKPRIIVASPIPAFRDIWTITDSVITNGIIPLLEKYTEKKNLEYLDLHSQFKNIEKVMQPDGIHPTDKGAAQIASLVAAAIKTDPKKATNSKKSKKKK